MKIVGVKFKDKGKTYYFNPNGLTIKKGDSVIVETVRGLEFGYVSLADKEVVEEQLQNPSNFACPPSGVSFISLNLIPNPVAIAAWLNSWQTTTINMIKNSANMSFNQNNTPKASKKKLTVNFIPFTLKEIFIVKASPIHFSLTS